MTESVENSPIALAIAQLVILVVNAILYSRQKSALDVEKRDRGAFGPLVRQAIDDSASAKREAERIEVEHYRKLAALVTSLATEHELCKQQLASTRESIASLSNKLASRERADRAAEKRAAADEAKETAGIPTGAGAPGVDELLHGQGIPLFPQQPAAPAAVPPTFGRAAKGGR